ncbi:hypothetical protein E1301_Tti009256 [Triplophysa tibetana]|uniref:Uncharacterized protein n=1 Tax=Triplophysa tibetana TaxID=1572043 RepID=A0A5A9NTA0_9TELE|nr:hypothetical protein E1301_Tti009256 [Triplophysa tibetana]
MGSRLRPSDKEAWKDDLAGVNKRQTDILISESRIRQHDNGEGKRDIQISLSGVGDDGVIDCGRVGSVSFASGYVSDEFLLCLSRSHRAQPPGRIIRMCGASLEGAALAISSKPHTINSCSGHLYQPSRTRWRLASRRLNGGPCWKRGHERMFGGIYVFWMFRMTLIKPDESLRCYLTIYFSVHHIRKAKIVLASMYLVSLRCKMNYIRYLLSLFELLVALSLLVFIATDAEVDSRQREREREREHKIKMFTGLEFLKAVFTCHLAKGASGRLDEGQRDRFGIFSVIRSHYRPGLSGVARDLSSSLPPASTLIKCIQLFIFSAGIRSFAKMTQGGSARGTCATVTGNLPDYHTGKQTEWAYLERSEGTLTRARTELNPDYLDLRSRAELNPEYWTPCTPLVEDAETGMLAKTLRISSEGVHEVGMKSHKASPP